MREETLSKARIADPTARYGNGKAATRQFITQRLSGASNLLFVALLVYVVVRIAGADRADMAAVIANAWVGLPLAVLIAIVAVHMRIGLIEVIEDYVHDPRLNRFSLMANSFASFGIAAIAVLSIAKLVFWG